MEPNSCLLYIEQSVPGDTDFAVSVLNIAGFGQPLYGTSSDAGCASLNLIVDARNEPAEIKKQLEAIPIVQQVTLVALSHPLDGATIAGIRDVFLKIGLNTQKISDEALSMFIAAKLQGRNTHYIDFTHARHRRLPVIISIQPIQDHPDFKPEWIQADASAMEGLTDKIDTPKDVTTITIESTSSVRPTFGNL